MEKSIKPKLHRKLNPVGTPAALPKLATVAAKEILQMADVRASDPTHMATLGALGLLVHIAEVGEQLTSAHKPTAGSHEARAVDPRNRVDPRKRFLPR